MLSETSCAFQFHVDVHAGAPLKLVPMQQIGTPTVSNTKGANSRTLIRHLDFQLQVATPSTASLNTNCDPNSDPKP